jgi:spore coat protein CotH
MLRGASIFLLIWLAAVNGFSQSFYDIKTIQKIELQFGSADWDYKLDTAKSGHESFVLADWVKINGQKIDSVGVKYKGNSSFDSAGKKNPLHIELNTFKDQEYQGFTDIKLSNAYADPSLIREVLSYHILQNYMDCPQANFAELYINGTYIGLYTNAESITKRFCGNHFFTDKNTFVKCNPNLTPGPTVKSNLKFLGADSSKYFNYYEMKSSTGWNHLVALCDTISNAGNALSEVLNIDQALWMLAFNNLLINLDSYNGAFAQNYYLYRDAHGRFNPIVWDLNMSFGGFPYAGGPNNGMGSLSIANMQNFPPAYHDTHTDWPLIVALLGNTQYKRMYIAHMRTLINQQFANNQYLSDAAELQTLIKDASIRDTNKFYSDAQFQNSLNTNISVGSYQVPGIANLMGARVTYLKSLSEFTQTPPAISDIKSSLSNLELSKPFYITATINNATAANLYFRGSSNQLFQKTEMFDDGKHGDGAAGDKVYGTSETMIYPTMQYYLYAENNAAGIFEPENAAHHFYTLKINTSTVKSGDVVINEFLASNNNSDINEYGIYTDWIELYNNTDHAIDLTGCYISNNFYDLQQYAFTQNAIIPANGYLIVWADGLSNTSKYAHSNFTLDAGGDQILLSNAEGEILDQISFSNQSDDVSMGRCPNGDGRFYSIKTPTFMESNNYFCVAGTAHTEVSKPTVLLYPNPANSFFTIEGYSNDVKTIELVNAMGQKLGVVKYDEGKCVIHSENMPAGTYFYRALNQYQQPVGKGTFYIVKP